MHITARPILKAPRASGIDAHVRGDFPLFGRAALSYPQAGGLLSEPLRLCRTSAMTSATASTFKT